MNDSLETRGKSGLVCSLNENADGSLRVILDDVKNAGDCAAPTWNHHTMVTFKDYQEKEMTQLSLSEKEFADFGHYVLARLVAQRDLPKKD